MDPRCVSFCRASTPARNHGRYNGRPREQLRRVHVKEQQCVASFAACDYGYMSTDANHALIVTWVDHRLQPLMHCSVLLCPTGTRAYSKASVPSQSRDSALSRNHPAAVALINTDPNMSFGQVFGWWQQRLVLCPRNGAYLQIRLPPRFEILFELVSVPGCSYCMDFLLHHQVDTKRSDGSKSVMLRCRILVHDCWTRQIKKNHSVEK